MNTVTMFGITFDLNPVAFTLPIGDGWDVYWYGILIALGFMLAFIYCMKMAPKLDVNTDRLLDAVIITTPIAILCARAYYLLFYTPSTFFKGFFSIHDGGLAIYGGIIGAVAGAIISCKWRKINFIDCIDLAAPGFFIGQAIGRWGNFFNQEAFGTNTTLPWGMFSEGSTGTYEHIASMGNSTLDPNLPVHPCFLYESILCAIGFIILSRIILRRKFRGQLILSYCIWYGTGRFFIEGIRTDSLMLGNIRVSQLLSAVIVIVAIIIYIKLRNKKLQTADKQSYKPMFNTNIEDDVTLSLSELREDEENGKKSKYNKEDSWES